MTAMLGSVRDAGHAETLIRLGVDIVELLDPDPAAVRQVCAARGAARIWAGVAGDATAGLAARVAALAGAGVEAIKVKAPVAAIAGLAAAAGGARLVVGLGVERIGDPAALEAIVAAGAAGVMLDPSGADERGLLERASPAVLRRFIADCRGLGLLSTLAGALEPPDVPRLAALAPDVIGFRRALMGHDPRRLDPDPQAVARLRALIPREGATPAPVSGAMVDRVFVRDLVVDMRLGLYARERGVRQPVRFTVEVDVARPARGRAEFRDVFSYDLITDRIRMMAESEHHDLVESVAEEVAAAALAHPAALRVRVRVEK
ncbi:MAG: dihydroneopterin aldolase, partial [Methylobacteriaceae bacterium]|nr:dihydroneopterin aldolase [Methylobacteriaceae bacterium]